MTDQEFSALVVETMAEAIYGARFPLSVEFGEQYAWERIGERHKADLRSEARAALGSLPTINAEVHQIDPAAHSSTWHHITITARYVGERT